MCKIYITTDTHFSHENIKKYCGRPENFDVLIYNELNKVLWEGDLLIHLGDVSVGNDKQEHWYFNNHLPNGVRKWLVRGNHDSKSYCWLLERGWDFVGESFLLDYKGKKVLFSHVPQEDLGYFDINIHGHFHNTLPRLLRGEYVVEGEEERNKRDLSVLTDKHFLISLEETKYKPVLLDTLLK